MILEGAYISLRALEPEDLDFLFEVENNTRFWEVSHTQVPFSKFILKQYLNNAHLDIYESKQLRLMIVEKECQQPVGMIDFFDFNPQHKRAGIGILINTKHQNNGYAFDALNVFTYYCFQHLDLHQLYANITPDNESSTRLFEKSGFKLIGEKKDWLYVNGDFKNELIYQLINE